jgi:hypothetical protein
MRIGLFTDTFLPEINGVVTVIQMMERELTREGHEVHIIQSGLSCNNGRQHMERREGTRLEEGSCPNTRFCIQNRWCGDSIKEFFLAH